MTFFVWVIQLVNYKYLVTKCFKAKRLLVIFSGFKDFTNNKEKNLTQQDRMDKQFFRKIIFDGFQNF